MKLVGISHHRFPVYQNRDGQYLYYWDDYQDWLIGSHYTSSFAGVVSKENKRSCPNTFSSWSLYNDGSLINVESVSATCIGKITAIIIPVYR